MDDVSNRILRYFLRHGRKPCEKPVCVIRTDEDNDAFIELIASGYIQHVDTEIVEEPSQTRIRDYFAITDLGIPVAKQYRRSSVWYRCRDAAEIVGVIAALAAIAAFVLGLLAE